MTNLEKAKQELHYLLKLNPSENEIMSKLELSAMPNFINPNIELPKPWTRCYVLLADGRQTIAEYYSKMSLEDEGDCFDDPDDYDVIEGIQYCPAGWYESLLGSDENIIISETVMCWMPIFDIDDIKFEAKQCELL